MDAHTKQPNVLRVNALIAPLLSESLKLTFGQRISDWAELGTNEDL